MKLHEEEKNVHFINIYYFQLRLQR